MRMSTVPDSPRSPSGIAGIGGWPALLRIALVLLLLSAVLFVSAGTLDWPMAWAYLGSYLILTVGSRLLMLSNNPDLVRERAGSASHAGVPRWDKRIMPVVAIYGPLAMQIVAGLDRRLGWSPELPLWLHAGALRAVILAMVLATWAVLVNRFFSAVVRIQTERGHAVTTSGPYRYVRHPGYAGGVIANLVTPIALGSLWALIPGFLVAALTVLRTGLEDRTLQHELGGYCEYAARVRYRLLPGVW